MTLEQHLELAGKWLMSGTWKTQKNKKRLPNKSKSQTKYNYTRSLTR